METNGKAGPERLGLAVHCPTCGAYFGRIVEHHGRPYLDDGHFLILTGVRHCHTCRRAFHWHGEKRRMGDWKDGRVEGWKAGRLEDWEL